LGNPKTDFYDGSPRLGKGGRNGSHHSGLRPPGFNLSLGPAWAFFLGRRGRNWIRKGAIPFTGKKKLTAQGFTKAALHSGCRAKYRRHSGGGGPRAGFGARAAQNLTGRPAVRDHYGDKKKTSVSPSGRTAGGGGRCFTNPGRFLRKKKRHPSLPQFGTLARGLAIGPVAPKRLSLPARRIAQICSVLLCVYHMSVFQQAGVLLRCQGNKPRRQ